MLPFPCSVTRSTSYSDSMPPSGIASGLASLPNRLPSTPPGSVICLIWTSYCPHLDLLSYGLGKPSFVLVTYANKHLSYGLVIAPLTLCRRRVLCPRLRRHRPPPPLSPSAVSSPVSTTLGRDLQGTQESPPIPCLPRLPLPILQKFIHCYPFTRVSTAIRTRRTRNAAR